MYLAEIKSKFTYKQLILDMNKIHKKNRAQIQIQTNIVKDNKTISESIKNSIQKEIIKLIVVFTFN